MLFELLNKYSNSPKQGTDEWKRSRMGTIGGSECSNFYGKKSLVQLASQKLGISTFNGNEHTMWGNVMEGISKNFSEFVFGTTVYEVGGVEGLTDDDGKVLIKYSPDGLAIVPESSIEVIKKLLIYLNMPDMNIQANDTILFEYKNPTKRVPDLSVPKQYIPQLLAGLDAIKVCNYAIFDDTRHAVINYEQFINSDKVTTWFAIYSNTPYTIQREKKIGGKRIKYNMLYINPCITSDRIEFYNRMIVEERKFRAYYTKRFYGTESFKEGSDKNKLFKHLKEARSDLGSDVHIIGFVFVEIMQKSMLQFYKNEDFPERSKKNIRRFLDKVTELSTKDDAAIIEMSDSMFN